MGKPLIMVTSVTYAMKAKQILKSYGIRCEIERTPKRDMKTGCSYSLYVQKDTGEAVKLLKENGIKVIGITERSS